MKLNYYNVSAGCRLPHLEKGMYLLNYKGDMIVTSGTEVNSECIKKPVYFQIRLV